VKIRLVFSNSLYIPELQRSNDLEVTNLPVEASMSSGAPTLFDVRLTN